MPSDLLTSCETSSGCPSKKVHGGVARESAAPVQIESLLGAGGMGEVYCPLARSAGEHCRQSLVMKKERLMV